MPPENWSLRVFVADLHGALLFRDAQFCSDLAAAKSLPNAVSGVSDSYLGVFRLSGGLPDIVLALSEVNCLSEEPKKTERAPAPVRRTDIPADTILIGKKPIMAYATAVMMHYNTGAKKLTLKARGRAISTAVDVAEVVNNRFFQGGLSKHVNLGTEIVGDGQDARNVSTIEIILERLK